MKFIRKIHIGRYLLLLAVSVFALIGAINYRIENYISVGDYVLCNYNIPNAEGVVTYKDDGVVLISGWMDLAPYDPRTGQNIPRLIKECVKTENIEEQKLIKGYKEFMARNLGCNDLD